MNKPYTLKDYGASIKVSWFPSLYQVMSDFTKRFGSILVERAVREFLLDRET